MNARSANTRGRSASASFADEVDRGVSVPLPGAGDTPARFRYLEQLAAADLALACLMQGHLDAEAILAEAGRGAPAGALMGVWAEHSSEHVLIASQTDDGWRIRGSKPRAAGASTVTHALVTAEARGGSRLFLIEIRGAVEPRANSWHAVGMRESDCPTVEIDVVTDEDGAIGDVGWYRRRPGFWHGPVGVAACWLGGARAVAEPLRRAASPHALAHLGAVDAQLAGAAALLEAAAHEIDGVASPERSAAERRARRVRAVVEHAATETLARVGRALGAEPLRHDAAHAQRVADLTVYLRESNGEVDLERLGRLVAYGD